MWSIPMNTIAPEPWNYLSNEFLSRLAHRTSTSEMNVTLCIWQLANRQSMRYVSISNRASCARNCLTRQTVITAAQALVDQRIVIRTSGTKSYHISTAYTIWQEGNPKDSVDRTPSRMKSTREPCYYCDALSQDMIGDHMVPQSRDGSNDLSNIVLACRSCNSRTDTRMAEEFTGNV